MFDVTNFCEKSERETEKRQFFFQFRPLQHLSGILGDPISREMGTATKRCWYLHEKVKIKSSKVLRINTVLLSTTYTGLIMSKLYPR